MSEEFKPIRITLSQEAFDRLEQIMKQASFRSYSSAIEECIRVVWNVIGDVYLIIGLPGSEPKTYSQKDGFRGFNKVVTRMERITGRGITE